MHSYTKATQNLNLQRKAKLLSQWLLLLKPGIHIRPDGHGITVKKPKGDNYVVKTFATMDEAHKFYFEGTK